MWAKRIFLIVRIIRDISACLEKHTRCSWQETKVWNPGATPKPSWSMNGGSSCVWIWTLIPASNDVSSVDDKRLGQLQQGWSFACTPRPLSSNLKLSLPTRSIKVLEYLWARGSKTDWNKKQTSYLGCLKSWKLSLPIHQNMNDTKHCFFLMNVKHFRIFTG